jgi:Spy/CpxP family protein refolding chaperone
MNPLTLKKAAAYLCAVFLIGAVSGASLTWRFARQRQHPRPASMDRVHQSMRDRFISRLELTPDQVSRITPFIEKLERQMQGNFREITRLSDEAISSFHASINPILTPDQREELQRMEQERRRYVHPKPSPSCFNAQQSSFTRL